MTSQRQSRLGDWLRDRDFYARAFSSWQTRQGPKKAKPKPLAAQRSMLSAGLDAMPEPVEAIASTMIGGIGGNAR